MLVVRTIDCLLAQVQNTPGENTLGRQTEKKPINIFLPKRKRIIRHVALIGAFITVKSLSSPHPPPRLRPSRWRLNYNGCVKLTLFLVERYFFPSPGFSDRDRN